MSLTTEQMTTLFTNLVRADHWGKTMYRRMMQGKLIGFYHPADGAIAPGVAAGTFLNQDDPMWPHHRGHGITHMLSKGIDIKYYLAEHTGKGTGCCGGNSGWHFSFPEDHVHLQTGFIGANFMACTGYAWAAKQNGRGQVVMNCSGDGSYGEGRSHEGMLMASIWKLPQIFMCENNGYSIFSPIEEMHPTEDIATVAQGLDIPAVVVDGQDVFAVAEVVLAAIDRARNGKGPSFIEAKCLRFKEHDIGNRDLRGWEPRQQEEYDEMYKRDPLVLATERVLNDGVLTQPEIDAIHVVAAQEVEDAEKFADDSPVARPSIEEMEAMVFAP